MEINRTTIAEKFLLVFWKEDVLSKFEILPQNLPPFCLTFPTRSPSAVSSFRPGAGTVLDNLQYICR